MDERVNADFERARTKAFVRDLVSLFRRQPNYLIPYHDIRNRLTIDRESYRGIKTVPLSQIVGSVDRHQDFDRAFLPRQRHTAGRWKNVDRAFYQDVRLPPIQLYQVGDIYFVKDGNHRVSVARERGGEFIDAEVIEGHVRVPLRSTMSPSQLLRQVEYAEFLRQTNLDKSRPDHDIRPTALGRYEEMIEHILAHQLSHHADRGTTVTLPDAAADWYDHVYFPIVLAVRDQGVIAEFPDRSEADVYLWVMRNRELIDGDADAELDPDRSAETFSRVEARRRPMSRRVRRFTRQAAARMGSIFDRERPG